MFPNPGPITRAMGKSDSLPGFLFSNPLIAGFFAMVMLSVFGAVAGAFISFLEPGAGSIEIFEVGRVGAIVALLFGVVMEIGVFVSALFLPEERANRLQFVLGGLIGLGALAALDFYVSAYVRSYLIATGA